MSTLGVCREFRAGEKIRCPAPGTTTPGRFCDAILGEMGRQGRARACVHRPDTPDPLPSPASYHLTRCKHGHWIRIETWEEDAARTA